MRTEMQISQTEVTTTSSRASVYRGLALATATTACIPTTWRDAANGDKPAGFNHVPAPGPGGTS